MKTSDILDIVSTKGITSRDLRRMTQQLQDAANKRVKRMMEDPIGRQSIVAARAQERIARGQSGYFTMEGVKTREQLRNRFQELQRFLGPDRPGSSLTQFKKQYKKIEEKLGGAPTADFWKAYRQLTRMYPDGNFPGGYSSEEVQRMLMKQMDQNQELTWEETVDVANRWLRGIYEEEESADYEEFFTIADDGEDLPFCRAGGVRHRLGSEKGQALQRQ